MFSLLAVVFATNVADMSLDEKVHELFIVPACPMREDAEHIATIQRLKPGGILFKQSKTPQDQVNLIHRLGIDVLKCADAEWGISMRVKEDVIRWPRNMTLGAIQDLKWLRLFGFFMGLECYSTGIEVNFAPVLDSPENPAIGTRSFGDNTAEKGIAVMEGMQTANIAATAKHYPGLQKSKIDPHYDLPVIERLDLAPFKAMVDAGVKCIMTTHVMFDNKIVTFSPELVEDIIHKEWGFDGLIITDAMNMRALEDTPGENAVRALEAGHDCLLYGAHINEEVDDILFRQVPEAIEAVKAAVKEGRISEESIDVRVARILRTKEKARCPSCSVLKKLLPLSRTKMQELKQELFRQAITLVGSFPPAGAVVVPVTKVTDDVKAQIKELQTSKKPYVIVLYTSPYALRDLGAHEHILVAYEDQPEAHQAIEEVLSGKIMPIGVMPVRIDQAAQSASQ